MPPIPSSEQAHPQVQYHDIGTPRVNSPEVPMGQALAATVSQEGSHSSYKSFDLFGPADVPVGQDVVSAGILPASADQHSALQPRVSTADSGIALQPRVSPADSGIALQSRAPLGLVSGVGQGYPSVGANAIGPQALPPGFGNQAQNEVPIGIMPNPTPQVCANPGLPQAYQQLLQAYH